MPILTNPVRKATPDDKPEILDMCRAGYAEHQMFRSSDRRLNEMMDRAFAEKAAIIGVIKRDGPIEGMIYLSIGQFSYTEDFCLEEVHSYVRPEFRRSSNAKDLIEFGKRCSDELGIPLVIGVVSNERTRAKMELYRRRLGDPVGGYFVHRPASARLQTA